MYRCKFAKIFLLQDEKEEERKILKFLDEKDFPIFHMRVHTQ